MRVRRLIGLVGAVFACAAAVALVVCPKPSLYGDTAFSTAVMARDGRLLRLALAGDERYRLSTALADIAPAAIEATLRYEDRHFY